MSEKKSKEGFDLEPFSTIKASKMGFKKEKIEG